MIYEINHILTAEMKLKINKWSSQWTQFMQCVNEVTGSNPVEVLNFFSGFFTILHKLRSRWRSFLHFHNILKSAKVVNSVFWKAKIWKSAKILHSRCWKAKILKAAKILNSRCWKAKILKAATILNSEFWKAKFLKSARIWNSRFYKSKIFKLAKILNWGFFES